MHRPEGMIPSILLRIIHEHKGFLNISHNIILYKNIILYNNSGCLTWESSSAAQLQLTAAVQQTIAVQLMNTSGSKCPELLYDALYCARLLKKPLRSRSIPRASAHNCTFVCLSLFAWVFAPLACPPFSYYYHNCSCGCINLVGCHHWNTPDCGIQKEEENRAYVVSLLAYAQILKAIYIIIILYAWIFFAWHINYNFLHTVQFIHCNLLSYYCMIVHILHILLYAYAASIELMVYKEPERWV